MDYAQRLPNFSGGISEDLLKSIINNWPKKAEFLAYVKEHKIDLKNPIEAQKVCEMFAPTEQIELTKLEGTQIPYEVPTLETPEALRVAEEQKEGKTRPENGV